MRFIAHYQSYFNIKNILAIWEKNKLTKNIYLKARLFLVSRIHAVKLMEQSLCRNEYNFKSWLICGEFHICLFYKIASICKALVQAIRSTSIICLSSLPHSSLAPLSAHPSPLSRLHLLLLFDFPPLTYQLFYSPQGVCVPFVLQFSSPLL